MTANAKAESVPLLDSDRFELNDVSDYSSSSIHYSTDYGTYYRHKDHNHEPRNFIESVSQRYSDSNEAGVEAYKDFFSDLKNVTISWSDINCYAPELGKAAFGRVKETGLFKQLLFDVSGVAHSGKLTAILGASGAGKTTLINIITCRNLGNLRVEGEVRVNGHAMHSNIKSVSAYVQQLDVFWGRLKVKEHLIYNAVLRMGYKYSMKEKLNRVDQLISELGLSMVVDDFINTSHKMQGLAGSEKKLLSLACELLVDPPILFLDEPTTGLDSKMAAKVVKTLEKLANKGKCILCTIHQPSSHIFEMFHESILLAEGRLIFQGTQDHALDFFCDVGFPCAENFNPADHFIHTVAIRPGKEGDCRAKVIYMARKFKDTSEYGLIRKEIVSIKSLSSEIDDKNIPKLFKTIPTYKASYWDEIKTQTWKQLLDQVRDPKLFAARFFQNIAVTIILAVFFLNQIYNQTGVNNISGVLYNVITNTTFLAVVQLNTFITELSFFYKEHQSGMCRPGSFFIAKNISEMPVFVMTVSSIVFIVYWSVGLYNGVAEFFIFTATVILIYQYSFSLNVLFVGSVFNRTDVVLNIAPLIRIVMMYFGGYLINDSSLPTYLAWLKYLSWQRYGFEILIVNQWNKVDKLKCEFENALMCFNTGSDVIEFMNFTYSALLFDFLMLIGLGILFRIAGLLVIMLRSRERKLN